MKITPTPLHAALAGVIVGVVMPFLWSRFGSDSMGLVVGFLIVVALPAHAFVVGFGRSQTANAGTLDTALLKRVGAWLSAAVITTVIAQFFNA
jgi:glycopeptide antibiotics resistance protein